MILKNVFQLEKFIYPERKEHSFYPKYLNTNSGYELMVNFLPSKQNIWVRFPLSAEQIKCDFVDRPCDLQNGRSSPYAGNKSFENDGNRTRDLWCDKPIL